MLFLVLLSVSLCFLLDSHLYCDFHYFGVSESGDRENSNGTLIIKFFLKRPVKRKMNKQIFAP